MLGTEGLRKRVGKELTSFMAYPERGEGGNSQWRGNCSPEVIAALLEGLLPPDFPYEDYLLEITGELWG